MYTIELIDEDPPITLPRGISMLRLEVSGSPSVMKFQLSFGFLKTLKTAAGIWIKGLRSIGPASSTRTE